MRFVCALSAVMILVLVGHGSANAQLPTLSSFHDLSLHAGAGEAMGTKSWKDSETEWSAGFEAAFLIKPTLDEWKKCATDEDLECTDDVTQGFAGFTVTAVEGSLGDSGLRAKASIREPYVGVSFQRGGGYAQATIRLPGFSSGRAYADDAARTAYKVSGEGIGAGVTLGYTPEFAPIFIEAVATWRYWPSIVVEPPSGVSLSPRVPEALVIASITLSAGLTFEIIPDK